MKRKKDQQKTYGIRLPKEIGDFLAAINKKQTPSKNLQQLIIFHYTPYVLVDFMKQVKSEPELLDTFITGKGLACDIYGEKYYIKASTVMAYREYLKQTIEQIEDVQLMKEILVQRLKLYTDMDAKIMNKIKLAAKNEKLKK